MLHGNIGRSGTIESAPKEQCKPDYEAAINHQREQQRKADTLLKAVYDYIGESVPNGKLAEMIGELHCEIRVQDMRINRLIAEQEKSSVEAD